MNTLALLFAVAVVTVAAADGKHHDPIAPFILGITGILFLIRPGERKTRPGPD